MMQSEEHMTDGELQQALFDAVVARLGERQEEDPLLGVWDRTPVAFSLQLPSGRLLTYQRGEGHAANYIARGGIQYEPKARLEDEDDPFDFTVIRSPRDRSKLQLNEGVEMGIDGIADDLVTIFLH